MPRRDGRRPNRNTCREDSSGTIVGCRLLSGEVMGTTDGMQVTCSFVEPIKEETALTCED